MDHQGLPPTDLVPVLRARAGRRRPAARAAIARAAAPTYDADDARTASTHCPRRRTDAARSASAWSRDALQHALQGDDVCLLHLPLGWAGDMWHFRHPLDFVGSDGGGGIGAGPGLTVGGAIALKGTSRLPVSILGDGDYLMGVNALWTAANAGVPLLAVVCNNRSFFNDEVHQERVAKVRGRPVENRWIGQRIDDPAPDLAMLARAQGLDGIGPVTTPTALAGGAARCGAARRSNGKAVVVDVHVAARLQPGDGRGHHARARLERDLPENVMDTRTCRQRPAHRSVPTTCCRRTSISTTAGSGMRRARALRRRRSIPRNGSADRARRARRAREDADAAIVAAHARVSARGARLTPLERADCCARRPRILRDERGSARDARRDEHRQSRGADGRRREDRRDRHRVLRGPRHRDQGRDDSDGAGRCSTTRCASRSAWWRGSSRTTIR